ncbi:MAG: nuclear transport factor 2 family protein, partial [Bacteroidota bacterium]
MRNNVLFCGIFLLYLNFTQAQNTDAQEVKEVVKGFFEAFHAKDSSAMKKFMAHEVVLQTTGRNREGKTIFKTQKIGRLYQSIVGIPDSVQFQEKLTSWFIQVDRTMA